MVVWRGSTPKRRAGASWASRRSSSARICTVGPSHFAYGHRTCPTSMCASMRNIAANESAPPQAAMPETYIHVVAAALFDKAGRVLIARRPDHLYQGGKWEFPGGKVEAGEAPSQALARELFEELSLIHISEPTRRTPISYA